MARSQSHLLISRLLFKDPEMLQDLMKAADFKDGRVLLVQT